MRETLVVSYLKEENFSASKGSQICVQLTQKWYFGWN